MADVEGIYESSVRPLAARDRLRLAALILSDLTRPEAGPIDFEDTWSDEDLQDLAAFSARHADESY